MSESRILVISLMSSQTTWSNEPAWITYPMPAGLLLDFLHEGLENEDHRWEQSRCRGTHGRQRLPPLDSAELDCDAWAFVIRSGQLRVCVNTHRCMCPCMPTWKTNSTSQVRIHTTKKMLCSLFVLECKNVYMHVFMPIIRKCGSVGGNPVQSVHGVKWATLWQDHVGFSVWNFGWLDKMVGHCLLQDLMGCVCRLLLAGKSLKGMA